ncbi:hypothetical protein HK096_009715 [Nowakowskiella sp. JEL0078]|nr:hypothetical protein HK096_009715 [Nowakowskiella sp. JEL0078]
MQKPIAAVKQPNFAVRTKSRDLKCESKNNGSANTWLITSPATNSDPEVRGALITIVEGANNNPVTLSNPDIHSAIRAAALCNDAYLPFHDILNKYSKDGSVVSFTDKETETFGFAISNLSDSKLEIVFRGTCTIPNWVSNLQTTIRREYETVFLRVAGQLEKIVEDFFEVTLPISSSLDITVTGHSLGGALSNCCSAWLLQKYGLRDAKSEKSNKIPRNILHRLANKNACSIKFITFGSALIATAEESMQLKKKFDLFGGAIKSLHLRNDGDAVPHLQKPVGYTPLYGDYVIKAEQKPTFFDIVRNLTLPPVFLLGSHFLKNHLLDEYDLRLRELLKQKSKDRRLSISSSKDIIILANSLETFKIQDLAGESSDTEDSDDDLLSQALHRCLALVQDAMDDFRFLTILAQDLPELIISAANNENGVNGEILSTVNLRLSHLPSKFKKFSIFVMTYNTFNIKDSTIYGEISASITHFIETRHSRTSLVLISDSKFKKIDFSESQIVEFSLMPPSTAVEKIKSLASDDGRNVFVCIVPKSSQPAIGGIPSNHFNVQILELLISLIIISE